MLYTHSMATLLRQEGDYTYWDDGSQRYAKGNAQGKAHGSLAKRHPKAGTQWASKGKGLVAAKANGAAGHRSRMESRRVKVSDAYAYALRNSHPDIGTEEHGLHEIAEAAFVQATDDSTSSAVKARAQFIEQYTGGKREDRVEEHKHVHITISPGVEQDQKRLVHNLLGDEVVDEE